MAEQELELNQGIGQLNEEVTYLKLREKKIMYLVHLLQTRGYPVTQVFEEQVKPINTLRFDHFLQQKEQEVANEEAADAKM